MAAKIFTEESICLSSYVVSYVQRTDFLSALFFSFSHKKEMRSTTHLGQPDTEVSQNCHKKYSVAAYENSRSVTAKIGWYDVVSEKWHNFWELT